MRTLGENPGPPVTSAGARARSERRQSTLRRLSVTPYLFLVPAFAFYGVFTLYPLVTSVVLSFFNWDIGLQNVSFVGLANFRAILSDPFFWGALKNNGILLVLAIIIPVWIGLVLAVFLTVITWGRTLFRAILFLPAVFSGVVVAYVWAWIYQPQVGLLDTVLTDLGLGFLKAQWLGNPTIAIYAIFAAYAWSSYGYSMVIFLAGLQNIDVLLYDAAAIDGAGAFGKFRYITVPGLRDTFTFVITLRILSSIGIFAIVFVLTGGGPFFATNVLEVYVYGLLSEFRWGAASAAATLEGVITCALALLFIHYREQEA